MNEESRKIVASLKNAFIVYIIIESIVTYILYDDITAGKVIGVLIVNLLALWIVFKILNSYDSVIADVDSQQYRIQLCQETLDLLEKEMKTLETEQNETEQTETIVQELQRRMEYLENSMRIVNKKIEITVDDLSSLHEAGDGEKSAFGLAEGYVQCGRCKEIQLASHTKCWKCNADLML